MKRLDAGGTSLSQLPGKERLGCPPVMADLERGQDLLQSEQGRLLAEVFVATSRPQFVSAWCSLKECERCQDGAAIACRCPHHAEERRRLFEVEVLGL